MSGAVRQRFGPIRKWLRLSLTEADTFLENPTAEANPLRIGQEIEARLEQRVARSQGYMDELEVFAAGAAVTLGSPPTGGTAPAQQPDAAERARWRKAYHEQRKVVAGLERRRTLIEVEINHIEDGQLTTKNLARLDRAEAKAQSLDEEIKRERSELAKIVREARHHGAEPGWFR